MNGYTPVLGRSQPGRDVAVMVDPGHDDVVSRLPGSGKGAADAEGQTGHVLTKYDLLRPPRIQKVFHCHTCGVSHRIRFPAGSKLAAMITAAALQVAGHGSDHVLRRLGSAGSIQVDDRVAVHRSLERRESGSKCERVQIRMRHVILRFADR